MPKTLIMSNENNELNEHPAIYGSKMLKAFNSFEEMNEADAQENAALPPEIHLQNASQLAKKVFYEGLKKPMVKKEIFKDGHSD